MKSLSQVSRSETEHREDELVTREETARTSETRGDRPGETFEWLPQERVQYFEQTKRSKLMARWIVGREHVARGDDRTGWQQTYRAIFMCNLEENPQSHAAAVETLGVAPVGKGPERRGNPLT